MKRPVQGRWRQTSFSHYSILSLTNMALFRFRLVNYFKKSLRIAAGLLEKCMKVPKVVLGRELKQLGQKRILVFFLNSVAFIKLSFYRDTLFCFGQFVKR